MAHYQIQNVHPAVPAPAAPAQAVPSDADVCNARDYEDTVCAVRRGRPAMQVTDAVVKDAMCYKNSLVRGAEVAAPGARGAGAGVPPAAMAGAPPWAAFLQQQVGNVQGTQANMQATLANVQGTQANMQATLANVQGDVTKILNRTSPAVVQARLLNGVAVRPSHPLVTLPHPDTLLPPPIFPATVGALRSYNHANCNALLQFYGLQVQGQLAEKRAAIGLYIGCPGF